MAKAGKSADEIVARLNRYDPADGSSLSIRWNILQGRAHRRQKLLAELLEIKPPSCKPKNGQVEVDPKGEAQSLSKN
jgi:hypothetical protein